MIDSSSTMPTAVITESSENTTSRARICAITPTNDAVAAPVAEEAEQRRGQPDHPAQREEQRDPQHERQGEAPRVRRENPQ
jgi:hypothetical protein